MKILGVEFPKTKADAQSAGETIEQSKATVDSVRTTVAVGTQQPPPEPENKPDEAATAAYLKTIKATGQEDLCLDLIGKSKVEALEALLGDIKTRLEAASVQKPEMSEEKVAEFLLSKMKGNVPDAPITSAQSEPNIYEQFKAITDPKQSTEFYNAHKAEIDKIANSPKTTKKEG